MKSDRSKAQYTRRRDFLSLSMLGLGVTIAGTPTATLAASSFGASTRNQNVAGGEILETVTGPIHSNVISWALAHEHMHGDFTGSNPPLWKALPEGYELPAYADTDWTVVTGAVINAVNEVAAQGVNLIVDYSPAGVGRNVRMLREVSRRTNVHIICASGLYRTAWDAVPPELDKFDVDQLAQHFIRELTQGTEGTGVRAGFIKLSVGDDGPLPRDEMIYRSAARAAIETGATIGMHARTVRGVSAALAILTSEKLDLERYIWAHAARDGATDYAALKAIADRGAYISFDGVAYNGVPSDERLLDFIERLQKDNHGHKVLLSSDTTVAAHPPAAQYNKKDIRYTYRYFKPKLEARFGAEITRQLLRDNVVAAYRRGRRVT